MVFTVVCFIDDDIEHFKYYAVAFGAVMALIGFVHYRMLRKRRTATEYLGGFIDTITHYNEWTEEQEYTVEVEDGKDSEGRPTYHTETRTRYIHHPDEWWFHTSIGTEHQFP